MLNEHQREYVQYLATLPPEKKCACGWYPRGECWNCPEEKGGRHRMTDAEALQEARRRWGPGAGILKREPWTLYAPTHFVGRQYPDWFSVYGSSTDWEGAFSDAGRR